MSSCTLCALGSAAPVYISHDYTTYFSFTVVDSGATNTSVWVVIDGKVVESRSQSINVGGWHVSECLKRALDTNSVGLFRIKIFPVDSVNPILTNFPRFRQKERLTVLRILLPTV